MGSDPVHMALSGYNKIAKSIIEREDEPPTEKEIGNKSQGSSKQAASNPKRLESISRSNTLANRWSRNSDSHRVRGNSGGHRAPPSYLGRSKANRNFN